jgi:sucrose-6-phosphate hydrolase SacC (GH32 family)
LTLGPEGKLKFIPAPELQILRKSHIHLEDLIITPHSSDLFGEFPGKYLEIIAEFEVSNPTTFGFKIFQSNTHEEFETIGYDMEKKQLWAGKEKGNIELPLNKQLFTFHIFIDNSVIEVYFNYNECLTSRIYPKSDDSEGIDIFTTSNTVKLKTLDIWKLKSTWE